MCMHRLSTAVNSGSVGLSLKGGVGKGGFGFDLALLMNLSFAAFDRFVQRCFLIRVQHQ